MTRFEKIARFLQKTSFQPGKEVGFLTDRELVNKAQRIWDAQIGPGDVIPEGTVFPSTTMAGVEIDWDADYKGFVLRKEGVVVRDDLTDNYVPRPIDLGTDDILVFHDDQYTIIDHFNEEMREELVLLDFTQV